MNAYLRLVLDSAGPIALIGLLLWIILSRTRNSRKLNMRDISLSSEDLEHHAKSTAIEHAVSDRQNHQNWPVPRMNENYDFILSVYRGLNEDIQKKRNIPPAAEWLLDNFYILEEQVKGLRRDLTKKTYARLPVLKSGPLSGYARIFAVAVEVVAHTDGQMDEAVLSDYLKAYQTHSVLFDREIWALPMVMRLALIENIRSLCESIKSTQNQWHRADEIIDAWMDQGNDDANRVLKLLKDSLQTPGNASPSFIEHIFYRLRRSGRSYAHLLRIMDETLVKLGSTTEQMTQKEHSTQSLCTVSMGNSITSLHYFATLDWSGLFESASKVEQILNQDPDGSYPGMDLRTRNFYRTKVEELASTYGVSELHIAREAVELAKNARTGCESGPSGDAWCSDPAGNLAYAQTPGDAEFRRTWHVGYYLIGKGLKSLELRQENKHRFRLMTSASGQKFTGFLYIGSIGLLTALLIAFVVQYAMMTAEHVLFFSILAGLAVLIPSSEIAVNTVNWIVCRAVKPVVFPRLELKDGIPESMSTFVIVPTLLPDEGRVEDLLKTLESHYLSNRDDNLYFALIGGFMDAKKAGLTDDPGIIDAAMSGVRELNRKYAGQGSEKFFFFHRENQYNEIHDNWIGWERKRGALMEFNELVLGSRETSFTFASSKEPPFSKVKYIITLDSDTILPMGMARKMIGTMAHPLNRPVIDKQRGIVVEGYGLMQPRIDVDVESSNRSLFSRIFTGQEGLDPYANAISDVYQDLFGEGIYTGKGIYDVGAFTEVLQQAIPENTILSHDLMEGSYVRTGLVTDLKLVDSHPSRYNAYSARLHRWVRGDWQLFPLLFRKILNLFLHRIDNPLSLLSRWKMFDNLRRSLVAPSLLILAALGFCILPGSIVFWLSFFLIAQTFPFITALVGTIFSGQYGNGGIKRYMPVMMGLKAALLQGVLNLAFLPYQAWSMVVAVSVTLARVLVTKKNLLVWVTSADMEKTQKNSLRSYLTTMGVSITSAVSIFLLALLLRPQTASCFLPFLLLWCAAPFVAYWISKNQSEPVPQVPGEDIRDLGRIARRTWRYFEEFTDARSHFLTPDNYQADPPRGVAYRTSPTNIGLGLLAILSARDFGYIGTSEMMDLVVKTVSNMERLEKWNGHLYNWYDTATMKPLRPTYISTVDSGNLACYLITLEQGLKDHLTGPLVDARFAGGIRDTLLCAGKEGAAAYAAIASAMPMPYGKTVDLMQWQDVLRQLSEGPWFESVKNLVWKAKITRTIRMHRKEMSEWLPAVEWMEKIPAHFLQYISATLDITDKDVNAALPYLHDKDEHSGIAADLNRLMGLIGMDSCLLGLPDVYREATGIARRLIGTFQEQGSKMNPEAMDWLVQLEKTLIKSTDTLEQAIGRYRALMSRVRVMAECMRFPLLFDKKKQLFSIGYNIEENKLTNSYYDLLASEARQTSYLCIARGEIPASHWSKMGRALTVVDGYKGLISWTGTMFEYLMPLLIMKSYENTLLDETYSFVIKSQKKYGRQRNMPWGTSESGFNALDAHLDYQYKAIGVPWLGLKRGLIEDAVAAPYATFLALLVDPEGAVRNIKYMKDEGLDGPYGFYEAADYTPERLPFETKRSIVKSFMAHHQGMSLLALDNFLHGNVMQERFHADPAIHAARLLLQEKIPTNLLFTKDNKEKVLPFKENTSKEKSPVRRYLQPDPILPKAHILSNGNYSVMLTDRGTGYSRNKMAAITRWRSDSTLDPHGMFFYLRDANTEAVWSATYAPMNVMPKKYEVTFTADKATFYREDGTVSTKTEVMVTSGDNAEIRLISLKNLGDQPCVIEVTSCFEVVLAPQAADVAHPAFSNLFVETGFLPERKCIVATRRPRSNKDKGIWLAHAAIVDGEMAGDLQYETDRLQWLGRGRTMKAPLLLERGKTLSNTAGPVLDPVMALRTRVRIDPGKTARIAFVTLVSGSNEQLLSKVDKYATPDAVEGAFRLALTRSQVENRYLNLDAAKMELYQDMISDILFISPVRRKYQDLILQSMQGQSSLWRYGISGDLPVVLLVLQRTYRVELLYEVLQAHEYWRLMDLKVDLVILGDEEHSYDIPLHSLISDIVLSRQTHDVLKSPGDVFIVDKSNMPQADVLLLYEVACIILQGDGRSMEEQINIREIPLLPKTLQFAGKPGRSVPPTIKEAPLVQNNGIGGFRPDGNEYVIRLDKGQNTPAPWSNVIANPRFGFLISESGSGYTWSSNSREYKLTPWSNDAVLDTPGEALYIGDGDTGQVWTASSLPIREEEPYVIRHGFGYSVFEHTSHGIEQWLTQHVPVDASVKISILGLRNTGAQRRNLTLTYYVQPVLGVSDQATAMHIRSRTGRSGMLLMDNPWQEEFAGNFCFVESSSAQRTITACRKEFFGAGDISSPESLLREGLSGRVGTGFDPCAAMQVKIALAPNERREVVFLLGTGSNLQEAESLSQLYRSVEKARESLAAVKAFWKERLHVVHVRTPVESMNLMLNGWLPYQVISCRLWARSGFYQSGGAFGFRDQLQDSLSVAHMWPALTRAQILLHAGHQFAEGDVQHWWHEPLGKGTRTRISDDLLWLPYVTAEYIRITGDESILNEEVPFLDEPVLMEFEEERYGKPHGSSTKSSLYNHCLRAIDAAMKFGEHGLPLIGTGDWNDGMNTVGNKGRGESVWLGWFLSSVLDMMGPLCRKMGDSEHEKRYENGKTLLSEALEKDGWDGNWYRRAYFDNGVPLGSAQNSECRIDSIAQTWSVISGAGNPQRASRAMSSMEEHLVRREDGLIKLLTPPFGDGELEPGYIKGYLPGVRENGGQYTHAAAWAIIAFAKMGQGDKAAELFGLINPINHTGSHREYSRYKAEPYVMAADVYAVHPHTGRGGWSWYTGSAGWMYRAGLESILGFQKNGTSLVINPSISSKWREYVMVYKYLDTSYEITVRNPDGVACGVRQMTVDGVAHAGNRFDLVNDGSRHPVEVLMGVKSDDPEVPEGV